MDAEGSYRYSDYDYLGWLCEGKLINLNGILYLPSRWEDNYSIWRNGLTGELHEEEIADGRASGQMNLAAAAKERGLDRNVWQLNLTPGDKTLAILDMNQDLQTDDVNYSLVLADRFFKDPDHFHNFVAYDFRACQRSVNDGNLTVVLREEL